MQKSTAASRWEVMATRDSLPGCHPSMLDTCPGLAQAVSMLNSMASQARKSQLMYKAAPGGARAVWLPHHRLLGQRAQSLETLYAAQHVPQELGPPASAACTGANVLSIPQRLLTAATLCCHGQPALLASIQVQGLQEEDCAAIRGSARQGLRAELPLLSMHYQA